MIREIITEYYRTTTAFARIQQQASSSVSTNHNVCCLQWTFQQHTKEKEEEAKETKDTKESNKAKDTKEKEKDMATTRATARQKEKEKESKYGSQ